MKDLKIHSYNVYKLSFLIGKQIGLNEYDLENLCLSSMYHDIGKLMIPKEILNKKGPLNEREREIVELHPLYSAKILKMHGYKKQVIEGALYHHERIDGNGYAKGLERNNIPLYSRIISIADTYDAITSLRPYKKPKSHEFAIEEIKNNSNIQFDKDMVIEFLKVIKSYKKVIYM